MDTVSKGDKLEAAIYALIQQELERDRFFVKRDYCQLFSKRGYYSRDREKEIVFDIAVEVYLPGQDKHSLLVLVECKNYNHPVPVDDAEEFFAKIQQISGANVKGIIASTGSFQDGTMKFSSSKGLGLLRYFSRDEFKWVLTRSPSTLVTERANKGSEGHVYSGLTTNEYHSRYFDCFCYSGGTPTNSLNTFFSRLAWSEAKPDQKSQLSRVVNAITGEETLVPYREEDEIEGTCANILKNVEYEGGIVPLEKICDHAAEEKGLVLRQAESTDDESILGKISFDPPVIEIYRSETSEETRIRFTLAHELGHLFLGHSEYMLGEYLEAEDIDLEHPPSLQLSDVSRLEWQANYFAAALLLPRRQFVREFLALAARHDLSDHGFGMLYVDDQPVNISTYRAVTDSLRLTFGVSRTVVRIRLEKFGFLNDQRKEFQRLF